MFYSSHKKCFRHFRPFRTEISFQRRKLSDYDVIWCPSRQLVTLTLLERMNRICSFLDFSKKETPRIFAQSFDFGQTAQYYRTKFCKNPVWWEDGHHFNNSDRFEGLPLDFRPYLNTLFFKLSDNAYKVY